MNQSAVRAAFAHWLLNERSQPMRQWAGRQGECGDGVISRMHGGRWTDQRVSLPGCRGTRTHCTHYTARLPTAAATAAISATIIPPALQYIAYSLPSSHSPRAVHCARCGCQPRPVNPLGRPCCTLRLFDNSSTISDSRHNSTNSLPATTPVTMSYFHSAPLPADTDTATQPPAASSSSHAPLAIIGMACRFPGHSNTPSLFWSNLLANRDCISPVPSDRWSSSYYHCTDKDAPGRIASSRCGFVDGVFEFDYEAFGINRKEAENMDPQQKLLLEVALQALEDARIPYRASSTGVYVGIGQAEQLGLSTADLEAINAYSVTGSALSIAANRLSYVFDLRGPSLSVDTACSSSMTAMHYAKEALRRGECEYAIVAGVNVLLDPGVMIQFSKLGVLSTDGRCKSFLDSADGYVRSEGCGVVVLTRLETAQAASAHIYALLRGTAVNSDGHCSPSLTMPSQQAQMEVFNAALADARVESRDILYAEAHATGTKVGDPIEANAIGKVLSRGRKRSRPAAKTDDVGHSLGIDELRVDGRMNGYHKNGDEHTNGFYLTTTPPLPSSSSSPHSPLSPSSPSPITSSSAPLLLGAVKSHVGHLETASFMAGLLKCLLMLQHETLVPNHSVDALQSGRVGLNAAIGWDEYGMDVVRRVEQFDSDGALMMVSSFGFGGSNGAAIIEGWKEHVGKQQHQHHKQSVRENGQNGHASHGGMNGHSHLNGHAESAAATVKSYPVFAPPPPPYVFLLSAQTAASLDARIANFKQTVASPPFASTDSYTISYTLATRPVHRQLSFCIASSLSSPASLLFSTPRRVLDAPPPPLVWCFSGQGPQHPDMGRTLYSLHPVFRASIDEMDALYSAVSGRSLVKDVGVFGSLRGDPQAVYTLQYTLPSLVMLQTALCDLWRSWGVQPAAVFGHSFGEMAAAYAAGVCNKRQLIETAYHRAKLLSRIDGNGVMMAVGCSPAQMQPLLDQHIDSAWIAAYNGPSSITVGGTREAITVIATECAAAGWFHRILKITNAYHTPLMRPCKDEALRTFSSTLSGVGSARLPYFSTVTAAWKESDFDAQYTWDGIEGAVHFHEAVTGCLERFGADTVFMEMSAHPVLSSYLLECGAKNTTVTLHRQQHEQESVYRLFVYLLTMGFPTDFRTLLPATAALPSFLPYSFQSVHCHKEDTNHIYRRTVPNHLPLASRPLAAIEPTWQAKVSLPAHPWTADHVVQGAVVFPAAGYLEMCMEVLGGSCVCDVTIGRAMIVGEAYRDVRTVLSVDGSEVRIYSKKEQWDSGPWTLHVTARKPAIAPLHASSSISLPSRPSWTADLISRCPVSYSKKAVYDRFRSVGLHYGPLFQGVDSMRVGDGEAYGVMDIAAIKRHSSTFLSHPALLDSCFHVLLGTIRYLYLPYVPTSIGQVEWFVPATELTDKLQVYARARLEGDKVEGELAMLDDAGRMVGQVQRMQCTALGQNDKAVQPTFCARWQSYAVPSLFIPPRTASWQAIPANVLSYEAALDAACVQYVRDMMNRHSSKAPGMDVQQWPVHRQRYWNWCQHLLDSHPTDPQAVSSLASIVASDPAYPFAKEVEAVTRAGSNLTQLLSDPFAVQRVLFADSLMSDIYSTSLTFRPYVRLMTELVVSYFTSHPTRVIHILELGAGTGALTCDVLTQLSQQLAGTGWEGRIKYYYTDVSMKFLHDAKPRFAAYPFIEYCLFNVDQPSTAIPPHSLDLILAFDVLHVSSSLSSSLASLQRLLVPNGVLMSIELTRPWLWTEMFFGLFQGWWGMDDGRERCWLTEEQWQQTLCREGWDGVYVVNDKKERGGDREFCHSLITAHARPLSALPTTALPSPRPLHVFDARDPGHDLEYLLSQSQQLIALSESHDFFLLTDDAQSIPAPVTTSSGPRTLPAAPMQALHVGFTRTLSNEASQHRTYMIDFEADMDEGRRLRWADMLYAIRHDTTEREFAIRGGKVYVPRFVAHTEREPYAINADKLGGASVQLLAPFRLEVGTVGQLSSLKYHIAHTPASLSSNSSATLVPSFSPLLPPSPTDVIVRVHASALNFKDLMLALGMLHNPLGLDRLSLQFDPPTALGIEFSGVVEAVGADVRGVAVGHEVFGIGKQCLGNIVRTHFHLVARKPARLSHREAASMPIVFATAYAGLIDKARVSAGERVLVHSAAGGIGQAAIQLCCVAGAEVICTVGSSQKRDYLRQRYGVTDFADSHSNASWHNDVKRATSGRGVDVVINSLKGDAIPLGLSLLTVGGRFVEIGKVDILANASLPMHALLNDISFLSVQLDVLMSSNTGRLQTYLQAVSRMAHDGTLQPLVDRVFGCAEVEAAFRYLMAGQHMGKVIIDFSTEAQAALFTPPPTDATPASLSSSRIYGPSQPFSPYHTYILTGGTGAVGLKLVQYLAVRGARHFLLLSRRGQSSVRPSDVAELDKLRRFGVQLLLPATDITSLDSVSDAYAAALQAGWPRAVCIFHLAMVLDDDTIPRLTEARLRPVIAPKVDGALNLLSVIPPSDVASVVFFSSAASVLGNSSQANYSAANAFLDAYAFRLSSAGYQAATVNLGVVEDVGVLAEDYKLRQLLIVKGFTGGLTTASICHTVEAIVRDERSSFHSLIALLPTSQYLHGSFDWRSVCATYPILTTRFAHLVDHTADLSSSSTADAGSTVNIDSLRALIAGLLGLSVDQLDVTEPLTRQGLDSLLAVELSATLKKRCGGLNVSQMELLGGMSVEAILEAGGKGK